MTKHKKSLVFVAMSGGVDSSVAALLLKQSGRYDLVGCYIKGWYPSGISCTWKDDRRDAMRVCARLGIPFMTIDAEKEYKKEVVDYMIGEYKAGRTPNPDVMCNKGVKFGVFLKKALKMGADHIATGHYVKIGSQSLVTSSQTKGKNNRGKRSFPKEERSDGEGATLRSDYSYKLKIAKDENKDQSYFLWALTQDQLKHCLFPLGDLTKTEVRKIAAKNNLVTADKDESMGVCFIGEFKMEDFLKKYIKPKKGDVVTTDGKKIGEHNGVQFYTIGQRHGFIQSGGTKPYFIVGKDIKKNLLIVADETDEKNFYKREVEMDKINWISGIEPNLNKTYLARIRYRQPLQKCKIQKLKIKNGKGYRVIFAAPQRAVTPGQSLVIYLPAQAGDKGGEMVGGGIIK